MSKPSEYNLVNGDSIELLWRIEDRPNLKRGATILVEVWPTWLKKFIVVHATVTEIDREV